MWPALLWVQLKIDMVQYNESLDKFESSHNEKHEATLCKNSPLHMRCCWLSRPLSWTLVVESLSGICQEWYQVWSWWYVVCCNFFIGNSESTVTCSMTCIKPHIQWQTCWNAVSPPENPLIGGPTSQTSIPALMASSHLVASIFLQHGFSKAERYATYTWWISQSDRKIIETWFSHSRPWRQFFAWGLGSTERLYW